MVTEREPLGKRLGRFATLLGVVAAVTFGVVLTQRLSTDALALLVGLLAGVLFMAPSIGFLLLLWRRQEARLQERMAATPAPAAPAVIVVSPPPAFPGYSAPQRALWDGQGSSLWAAAPAERKFTIVGGES